MSGNFVTPFNSGNVISHNSEKTPLQRYKEYKYKSFFKNSTLRLVNNFGQPLTGFDLLRRNGNFGSSINIPFKYNVNLSANQFPLTNNVVQSMTSSAHTFTNPLIFRENQKADDKVTNYASLLKKNSQNIKSNKQVSQTTVKKSKNSPKNQNFEKALEFVLAREGGYASEGSMKGIMQNTYNKWRKEHNLSIQSVKYITDNEVKNIYHDYYWVKSGCDNLDYDTALFIFDTSVNMGVSRGTEYLTRYKNGENLDSLIMARRNKYHAIAEHNPSKAKYLKGWLNRMTYLENEIALA